MLLLIEGVVGVVICEGADVVANWGCGRGGFFVEVLMLLLIEGVVGAISGGRYLR